MMQKLLTKIFELARSQGAFWNRLLLEGEIAPVSVLIWTYIADTTSTLVGVAELVEGMFALLWLSVLPG